MNQERGELEEMPFGELGELIQEDYHDQHRLVLPILIRQSRELENEQKLFADTPLLLSPLLSKLEVELELHMQKEEQTLFPKLEANCRNLAASSICNLEREHRDIHKTLNEIHTIQKALANSTKLDPAQQSFLGSLRDFKESLTEHMSLENNNPFKRVLLTKANAQSLSIGKERKQ